MTESAGQPPAAGIEPYPGPYAVGRYAARLRDKLRSLAQVCLVGEVVNVRMGRGPNVWFELRDADGALPCAIWRNDLDRLPMAAQELRDGLQVVVAGGCDYYPGGATASPSFCFRVRDMRPAGEGDLLARLARLRRQLAGEGLFEPQKRLARRTLPRRIGVVTAQGSAACRDFLAGLERRGWRGTIVWAHAPVQDRRAAPAIATALRDLAAVGDLDAIVVTRGGGSIADLWAFCDETLCRTVALLPVPVISAVGHEVDRTLLDDVAAVSCSTPTHAAEAAVGVDCRVAARELLARGRRIDGCARAAVVERARALRAFSRAPREQVERHRRGLHQTARELRAASGRRLGERLGFQRRIAATVLARKRDAALAQVEGHARALPDRGESLDRAARAVAARAASALRAHAAALRALDPERALERGYALALDERGQPLEGAAAVRAAGRFDLRLADGTVPAQVRGEPLPDGMQPPEGVRD